MASAVNSLPSNGAGATPLNSSVSPNTMASRAAGRPSSGVKGADVSRRQSGSPVDGGQRCVFSCLSLDARGSIFPFYTRLFFFSTALVPFHSKFPWLMLS